MEHYIMLDVMLDLFDGAAGAGNAVSGAADVNRSGEILARPGVAGRGRKSGETQKVLYGKQAIPGVPAKAVHSFCGERTSKGANEGFAAGGNGVERTLRGRGQATTGSGQQSRTGTADAGQGGKNNGAAVLGTRGSGDGAGAANSEAAGRRISQGEFTSPVVMKSGGGVCRWHTSTADRAEGENPGETQRSGLTGEDPAARRAAYEALINGEYKDLYTQDTQRMIDRRFRETKELEAQVKNSRPVLEMLMERYGIGDGDMEKLAVAIQIDSNARAETAQEVGKGGEQHQQLQRMQQIRLENAAILKTRSEQRQRQGARRQLRQWSGEAEQARAVYQQFDLGAEAQDPRFRSMLRSGVPVQLAYEVIHMDEIKNQQARVTEKQVLAGIRAKGVRPQENGIAAQSGFTVKNDVSKLTRADRAEIARRVARGEKITF